MEDQAMILTTHKVLSDKVVGEMKKRLEAMARVGISLRVAFRQIAKEFGLEIKWTKTISE